MTHDHYKALLATRALSALDGEDERALNQHLGECAECRLELADYEATAAQLALSAEPAEPSPEVRQRILDQIHAEKSESSVLPFAPASRNVWQSFGSLGAIAAVILFVALLVSVFVLWQQNRTLQRSNEFVELINTPGVKMMELSGTEQASGATAKLAYDKTGHAMLVANGLPRAPQGKQYQLWYIVGARPLPGKSFSPDSEGKGMMVDQVPEAARESAIFAITLEPEGGMSAPSGAVYLRSGL